MKRKIVAGILAIILSISLFACGPEQKGSQEGSTSSDLYADTQLSNEQMLSDYDTMWKAMKESYPFWGVLARSKPEDPDYYDAVISDYRGQLQRVEAGSDEAMEKFLYIVAYSLYEVCGTVGHVSIINPDYFQGLDVYKQYADEMPEVQPWVDVIEKPEFISFYK